MIFTPDSGFIDYFVELVAWVNPVSTRAGDVYLLGKDITQRNGNIVVATNEDFGTTDFRGEYSVGNLGFNIGDWNASLDDGTANVSGWTIQHFERYFADIQIRDFEDRKDTNFTRSGDRWNLANSSFQNPVAIVQTTANIDPTITVQSTTYFPDSGHLFTSGGSVVQYTSKTQTTFEGCTVVSGSTTANSGQEIVPHVIS